MYHLTDAELAGYTLDRFNGPAFPAGRAMGLLQRGWERQAPQDAGWYSYFYRPVGEKLMAVVDFEPGLSIGLTPDQMDDQRIDRVRLAVSGSEWRSHACEHTFADVDPVAVSELVRELRSLTA